MRRVLNLKLGILAFFVLQPFESFSQNIKDSTKAYGSFFINAGACFYYPGLYYVKGNVGLTEQVGFQLNVSRAQIGLSVGHYTFWDTGGPYLSKSTHSIFAHFNGGAKLFNIKKNILILQGGVYLFFPFLTSQTILVNVSGQPEKRLVYTQLKGLGVAASLGIQYQYAVSKRLKITLQTNFIYTVAPAQHDGVFYRFPHQTFLLGIEYQLGKKARSN